MNALEELVFKEYKKENNVSQLKQKCAAPTGQNFYLLFFNVNEETLITLGKKITLPLQDLADLLEDHC